MSESEMVERVARAIFEVSAPYHDDCCLSGRSYDACPCREIALEQASAAIKAMRETSSD